VALLTALALSLPAGAYGQSGGELPEQLRVIADVRFQGMKHLGKRQLKAANLKTRRPSSLPWRERPSLRLDYLRADTASIAALYRHYGYLDARATWRLESTRDPAAAKVVFVIEEGARSHITNVALAGVHAFKARELDRLLLAQPGRAYDPAFLPIDTLHLAALYQERGYRPHTLAGATRGAPDSLAIAVNYRVNEGPRYTIGRVDYEATGHLRESLARRELLLHPGDVYRRSRVEQSVQRLYDTGLYSQIQVSSLIDTSAGKLDLLLHVAERRARWVDLGIGSGSVDLFRFTGEWGHRNLDTRGLLGSLNGVLALEEQRRDSRSDTQVLRMSDGRAAAGLVEPWLFGVRLQGSGSLFYEDVSDARDARFLQRRDSRGVELGLLHEFSRMFRASLTGHTALVHQSYDVFLTAPDSVRDSLATVLERYWDNGYGLLLIRDSRDDRITPTRGSLQTVALEVGGGPLKGASRYRKVQLVSSWYTTRPNNWQVATRLSGGIIGPRGSADFGGSDDPRVAAVPQDRRFYIGGVNSLRGFGEGTIVPGGGLAMVLGNAELRVPVMGPFGAEFFVDAGNVWRETNQLRLADVAWPWLAGRMSSEAVRYSYGLGARLMLPFGPLRLDLAWSRHPEFPHSRVFGKLRGFAYQIAIGPSF
jgi:outer membrane protein insertion porin family